MSFLTSKTLIAVLISAGLTILGITAFNWHTRILNDAVTAATNVIALEQQIKSDEREKELLEIAKEDLEVVERQLRVEKQKVVKLEKQLLIEHDLDKLLQQKPGLILSRVNEGTAKYFQELEEITQ
jgi:5-bromo-4-chloroindolyl phosphate hydrolysis protein